MNNFLSIIASKIRRDEGLSFNQSREFLVELYYTRSQFRSFINNFINREETSETNITVLHVDKYEGPFKLEFIRDTGQKNLLTVVVIGNSFGGYRTDIIFKDDEIENVDIPDIKEINSNEYLWNKFNRILNDEEYKDLNPKILEIVNSTIYSYEIGKEYFDYVTFRDILGLLNDYYNGEVLNTKRFDLQLDLGLDEFEKAKLFIRDLKEKMLGTI
ncbi:hypothetical protein Bp8pS_308 [Bacillus phage vB_BpuM-BpSp]|nr:hypothetical protein Bp8pS_308 [Bacillus phage vB_BpuM-BpSp]